MSSEARRESGGRVRGDFYTAPHAFGRRREQDGHFHWSYFGGEPVLCAGEIRIEDGAVLELNTRSGHYWPTRANLVSAVEILAIVGVDLNTLQVTAVGGPTLSGTQLLLTFDYAARGGVRHLDMVAPDGSYLGNTPLSRWEVRDVRVGQPRRLIQFEAARMEREAAFRLLKAHWRPGAVGAHGAARRDECLECVAVRGFWATFVVEARDRGGIGNVRVVSS